MKNADRSGARLVSGSPGEHRVTALGSGSSAGPDQSPASLARERRSLLRSALAAGAALVSLRVSAQPAEGELAAAIRAFARGAEVSVGGVQLEVAPLVENGNAVPITVSVDSPMIAADHVKTIAVFNERNPQRDVALFHLGPRAGRARVSARIRLATSQRLVAVASMSDGSYRQQGVDVIVTLAACVEG